MMKKKLDKILKQVKAQAEFKKLLKTTLKTLLMYMNANKYLQVKKKKNCT